MDSPWNDDHDYSAIKEAEWTKMSSEFTNAGFREGITEGKEAAVQEGFDDAFANVGAPLGRDLGLLRGHSAAILAFLTSQAPPQGVPTDGVELLTQEAREIAAQLGRVRYSDIEPRDLEAEEHAREHLEMEALETDNDEILEKRKMERIEDMMAKLAASTQTTERVRPTLEDVYKLKARLETLGKTLGFDMNWM
ncbi:hypothetical protein BDZ94DRAFT_1246270 [Collybia nuda]|uniref:Protein YAE1 n=1 Tax=Collybia nuda TaxID=64659 RepID=A0A9P5YGI3_9AGAR|nr:hypothetical protein BDZ94DRAFT_1246270 [Collybia nuda]